jgi:hypothetical protein
MLGVVVKISLRGGVCLLMLAGIGSAGATSALDPPSGEAAAVRAELAVSAAATAAERERVIDDVVSVLAAKVGQLCAAQNASLALAQLPHCEGENCLLESLVSDPGETLALSLTVTGSADDVRIWAELRWNFAAPDRRTLGVCADPMLTPLILRTKNELMAHPWL